MKPHHADLITLYSGFVIALGYLIGSVVRAATERSPTPWVRRLSEAGAAIIWAGVVWRFIDAVAPGTSDFRNFSAIGFLSSKALTVWESVSLWAGLAVVIGLIAPAHRRGRNGSTGLAAAAGLVLAFSPLIAIASGVAFVVVVQMSAALGQGVSDDHVVQQRYRRGQMAAFLAAPATEWLLSMTDLRLGLGVINGPESTLWMTALAGVLIARWTHTQLDQ